MKKRKEAKMRKPKTRRVIIEFVASIGFFFLLLILGGGDDDKFDVWEVVVKFMALAIIIAGIFFFDWYKDMDYYEEENIEEDEDGDDE